MPATVRFVEHDRYVEVRYFDHLTMAELLGTLQQLATVLGQHGCTRLLADCRDIRTGPTISEMYQAVSGLRDEQANAAQVKQALVLPTSREAADVVTFWETASVNRGMWAQSFTEHDAALAWLLAG